MYIIYNIFEEILASHAVLVIVYYVPDDEPLSSKHVEAE
jgi:hypothetical protein